MTQKTPQETCWTVIRGAADGSPAERSLFSRQYIPVVRSYLTVKWQGSHFQSHVDDAVQEVFLECFKDGGVIAKADPERPGGFRRFLLGAVRNVAARIEKRSARRHANRASDSFHPEALPSDDKRPSQVFARSWAQAVMEQALEMQERRAEKLGGASMRRLELLRLRFMDEMPIREIAARWQEDSAAVHREYRKAREEFKDCLQRVVVFNDPHAADDPSAECKELFSMLE